MRGLLATLSVLSAMASLVIGLTYLLAPNVASVRTFSIILWTTTLIIGVVSGSAARKAVARERAGLARSTIALFVSIVSLTVGVVAFVV